MRARAAWAWALAAAIRGLPPLSELYTSASVRRGASWAWRALAASRHARTIDVRCMTSVPEQSLGVRLPESPVRRRINATAGRRDQRKCSRDSGAGRGWFGRSGRSEGKLDRYGPHDGRQGSGEKRDRRRLGGADRMTGDHRRTGGWLAGQVVRCVGRGLMVRGVCAVGRGGGRHGRAARLTGPGILGQHEQGEAEGDEPGQWAHGQWFKLAGRVLAPPEDAMKNAQCRGHLLLVTTGERSTGFSKSRGSWGRNIRSTAMNSVLEKG